MDVDSANVPTARTITVEVWSDVVCPWCYIGKRRFAAGVDQVAELLAADGIDLTVELS